MLCGGSIGLQADTVTLASSVPLEFPAPPSLQILAIARYRCGLRLVWHENPSLLFVPSRVKHYTSYVDRIIIMRFVIASVVAPMMQSGNNRRALSFRQLATAAQVWCTTTVV